MNYSHNLCVLDNNSKGDTGNGGSNPRYDHNHLYQQHQEQALYSIIKKYISEGYSVIYAAEYNTPIQSIVENMIQNGIKANNLIKDCSLIITNPDIIYSIDKCINAKMILQALKSFIFDLLRKNNNKSLAKGKKIVIILTRAGF